MKQNEVERWVRAFNNRIAEAFHFSYPVRDRTLQSDAAESLQSYLSELEVQRAERRDANDADAANLFLAMSCYARSMISVLRMWLALRADDPNDAWVSLVGAQDSARSALRAHHFWATHMANYIDYLYSLEHILFPPQQFVSSSFVVKSSDCSLCGAPYHECDHIASLPYNGEFCIENCCDISAIDHVALVDVPDDKSCRITSFSKDGVDVDSFTLRRTDRDGDKDDRTARAILMTQK